MNVCAEGQTEVFRSCPQIPRSPCVFFFLLTEAEVQAGALCDRGGGACAGYGAGGDAAVFTQNTENTVNYLLNLSDTSVPVSAQNISDLSLNLKSSGTNTTLP